MGQYVHVLTRHVGPMAATSQEEKPTAPLMPAVQPATLLPAVQPAVPPAVQPAVPFAAVQQVNKLDVDQRHEQTLAILAASSGGAHCA